MQEDGRECPDGYLIPPPLSERLRRHRNDTMNDRPSLSGDRRIAWQNVLTVLSAAILIGAEVFGAAFAGGWAVANLLDLGPYGVHILQGIFFLCGIAVMVTFIQNARQV